MTLKPGPELTVSQVDEADILERIFPLLPHGHRTHIGPGDDAAILNVPSGQAVISTDVLVEGHHFRTDWSTPEDIGYRAAVQNLADIAAMGATPTGMVVGLVLPPNTPLAWVEGLARGLAEATAPEGVGVIGGDLVAGEQLVIAVTIHGETFAQPVLRSGAQPGDVVAVAGNLGRAAAGYALISAGHDPAPGSDTGDLITSFRRPTPPLSAGVAAVTAEATAMMDISDGLLKDGGRLARASGVTIDLASEALEADVAALEPAQAALESGAAAVLSWVLTGGEDHGLLATFPAAAELPADFRPIGRVVAAGADAILLDGQAPQTADSGWDHFDKR